MRSHQLTHVDLVRRLVATAWVVMVIGCGDDATGVSNGTPRPPRNPTLRVVSGDRQTGEVATELREPLVVALRDSLGRPMAGTLVRFYGDRSRVDSALTDATGLAVVRWTLGTTAGPQQIEASVALYAGTALTSATVKFGATALAGPLARIDMRVGLEMGLPGTTLDTVSAVASDRFSNPLAAVPITWLAEQGGGSVRALSTRTDAQGLARAIWTLGASSGENVLVATAGSVSGRLEAFGSPGFPATAVVIGGTHGCAISPSGAAYCWGSNAFGQLGIGTMDAVRHPFPTRVAGGLTFTALVAGVFHVCGLTPGGEAYCWGANYVGQLGIEAPLVTAPVRAANTERFTALAAGAHHTCGLTIDRRVLCWGNNLVGELGDGVDRRNAAGFGSIHRSTPEPISGGRAYVALAASFNTTCAVSTLGPTYCWGGNSSGELGTVAGTCRILADPYYQKEDWDWPCSTVPVPVSVQASVVTLTGSGNGFCGIMIDGVLLCWGGGTSRPIVIPGARVSAAWALGTSVCGLDGGTVACWGIWANGARTPPPFGDGVTLVDLTSTGSSSCGLSPGRPGVAYCWGWNDSGQLGDGTTFTGHRTQPAAVALPRIR